MSRRIYFAMAPILLLFAYSSCTRDHLAAPTACAGLPDTVSFNQHIIPLFEQHCSIPGCHNSNSSTSSGNLNLESGVAYAEVTNPVSGYVDTADPTASLLYYQMTLASNIMPPTGALDHCSVQLVLKWIEQKAKNN